MSIQDKLVIWGRDYYKNNIQDVFTFSVKADTSAGDRTVLKKIKEGRTFGQKDVIFEGFDFINNSPIIPVSLMEVSKRTKGRIISAEFGSTTGAYRFKFKQLSSDEEFSILFMLYEFGTRQEYRALALIPSTRLNTWAYFENKIEKVRQPKFKPSREMAYVIGSYGQESFKPEFSLDEVIIEDSIKQEILNEIEFFFTPEGLSFYQKHHVPPFRKMLIYGQPGVGKSMCANALAADQMKKGRTVVYVSSSDKNGSSFSKIKTALEICAQTDHPIFLIVEEVESYLGTENGIAQVRNVLEGFESPNNKHGSFLLMTSNQPILDQALLRFGRIDRKVEIPKIRKHTIADRLLKQYLGELYDPKGIEPVIRQLSNLPPVFVRELAFHGARMAASNPSMDFNSILLDVIKELKKQPTTPEALQKISSSSSEVPFGLQHLNQVPSFEDEFNEEGEPIQF